MLSRVPFGAVVLLLALVTGCTSDPPKVEGGASGSGSSPTSPASASSEPTETDPPDPGVTPATGPELLLKDLGRPVLRLRLPEEIEWRIQPGGDRASGNYPDGTFADITARSTGIVTGKPFGFYAASTAESLEIAGPDLKRLEDRTVQGVRGFVLEGKDQRGLVYVFGALSAGAQVDVIFELPRDGARARTWIEAVLASAEWL